MLIQSAKEVFMMAGFQMFDTIHLSWLLVILIFIFVNCYMYKTGSIGWRLRWQRSVFWALFILEIIKQLYLAITDQYTFWSPPLHLCGFGIFIIGIHVYCANRTTSTLLFALTLPGAVIALIFPGWTTDPVGGFLHVHSFIFHALLIVYVVSLLITNNLNVKLNDLWRAVVFLLVTVPIIYFYNQSFNTNFMFLNQPVKGTPLQWLYDAFGAGGYIGSLIGVLSFLWIAMYSAKSVVTIVKKKMIA